MAGQFGRWAGPLTLTELAAESESEFEFESDDLVITKGRIYSCISYS